MNPSHSHPRPRAHRAHGLLAFFLTLFLGLTLAGCGGTEVPAAPAPEAPSTTVVGAAGGTVTGPGGATLVIPAGALTADVAFKIALAPADAPAMTVAGAVSVGQALAITPHGTHFAAPVTVSIPFDATLVPSGQTASLYKAEAGGSYAALDATVTGSTLVANVSDLSYFAPVALPSLLQATALSDRCLREALTGQIWCWGDQGAIAYGSGLGVPSSPGGTELYFVEPVRLPPRAFGELVATSGAACGISNGSEVWCIGDTFMTAASGLSPVPARTWVQIPMPAGVNLYRLSMGGTHVCGIASPTSSDAALRGKVYCWGDDLLGQLGRGAAANASGVMPVSGNAVYAYVAAGGGFTCASQEFADGQTGGAVDCWGSNLQGQVTVSPVTRSYTPLPRNVVAATRPGALKASASNACAIQNDGTTLCWGDNYYGQKGDGTATTGVSGQQYVAASEVLGHKFSAIAPGDTTCGIDLAGTTWCWGYAKGGSLGTGQDNVTGGKQTTPAQVAGPVSFVELSSALCGRTQTGEVYCWGPNNYWELGLGQSTPALSNVPVRIKSTGLSKAMH